MKLKNKRTGEIVEFFGEFHRENKPTFISDASYTLEKLCEEWSDYEEPKEYWYIDEWGNIDDTNYKNDVYDNAAKEIGNVFSSKEEAEKAVEKLKAWKRLKDKGFEFSGYGIQDDYLVIKTNFHRPLIGEELDLSADNSNEDLLDLLFGGEE